MSANVLQRQQRRTETIIALGLLVSLTSLANVHFVKKMQKTEEENHAGSSEKASGEAGTAEGSQAS
jgi:hypothetical protein